MHGWGLLQLLVIINYLVLFIEYAYQTLVCPMLYRYHLILLLYFVCLFVFFYWFFFIVTLYCVSTLHIVSIYLIIVMILPLMGPWLEINTFVFVFVYKKIHIISVSFYGLQKYRYYLTASMMIVTKKCCYKTVMEQLSNRYIGKICPSFCLVLDHVINTQD